MWSPFCSCTSDPCRRRRLAFTTLPWVRERRIPDYLAPPPPPLAHTWLSFCKEYPRPQPYLPAFTKFLSSARAHPCCACNQGSDCRTPQPGAHPMRVNRVRSHVPHARRTLLAPVFRTTPARYHAIRGSRANERQGITCLSARHGDEPIPSRSRGPRKRPVPPSLRRISATPYYPTSPRDDRPAPGGRPPRGFQRCPATADSLWTGRS